MRRPPFTPLEDSWYSFLLEAESTAGPIVRLVGLVKLKKKIHLIGTRTRDLPACSIMPVGLQVKCLFLLFDFNQLDRVDKF
jgi:hypothetical protein